MKNIIYLALILTLSGCALTRGSGIVTGETRPPTEASQVKLYTSPPANYQEIAIVSADSRNDFMTSQALADAAIERLKKEAAKVGANGVILESAGDKVLGSSGSAIGLQPSYAVGSSVVRTGKQVKGRAIFVSP